jgi:hypothetical protein
MKRTVAPGAVLSLIIISLSAGFGPYRLCQGFVDLVGDKLEWRSRHLAGPKGVNCGRVEGGHDARAANDCVRNALSAGQAFRVRYRVPTTDSDVSTGLVRSRQGELYEMILDGNPGKAGPTSLFRQRIAVRQCEMEMHLAYGGRLTCLPDGGF